MCIFLLMSMCFLYTVSSPISPLDSSGLLSPALSDDTDDDNAEKETFEVIMNKGVTGLGFLIEGGKASAKGDQPLIIKRIFKGKEHAGPCCNFGNLIMRKKFKIAALYFK